MQDLIENKPFDLLTDAEKSQVLAEMTAAEYRELHELVNNAKNTLQDEHLSPSPAVQAHLRAQFIAKYPSKNIFSYSIPLWVVVLAMALLSGVFSYFYNNKTNISAPKPVKEIEQVFVYQTDTIYLDKTTKTPLPQPKTINQKPSEEKKNEKVTVPIAKNQKKSNSYVEEPMLTYHDSNAVKIAQDQANAVKLDADAPVIEVKVW